MTLRRSALFQPFGLRGKRLHWRPETVEAIASAQGHRCAICGGKMGRRSRSVDHVRPLSHGGEDAPGNITIAHVICNERKADARPTGCQLVFVCLVNEALGLWERPPHRPRFARARLRATG